jgi:hypothetical protein
MPVKEILSCLGCSKIFFRHRTLFYFMCLHRLATWAGSRAGSLASEYLSLVYTEKKWEENPGYPTVLITSYPTDF